MERPFFKMNSGEGPVIVAAIHNGHYVRKELIPFMALSEKERTYEEDPYTGFLADIAPTRLVAMHSRFEIDLNREKSEAIYKSPEQAWGLKVWETEPTVELISKSLQAYEEFYAQMESLISNKIWKYGYAIVYDLHSYNHCREGKPAPQRVNPDVNIGYNGLDRSIWATVIDGFAASMKKWPIDGLRLDVRENIKFRGGHFSTWINRNFDNKACALAIELKKIFMDELTGEVNERMLSDIKKALAFTITDVVKQADLLFGKAVVRN